MRYLEFKITGQKLESVGDFSGLVPGTSGYLAAKFTFDNEWDKCIKIASFFNRGKEYAAVLKNGICVIPSDALTGEHFKVRVTGTVGDFKILTNKFKVKQKEV